jgi:hypothetical protein
MLRFDTQYARTQQWAQEAIGLDNSRDLSKKGSYQQPRKHIAQLDKIFRALSSASHILHGGLVALAGCFRIPYTTICTWRKIRQHSSTLRANDEVICWRISQSGPRPVARNLTRLSSASSRRGCFGHRDRCSRQYSTRTRHF